MIARGCSGAVNDEVHGGMNADKETRKTSRMEIESAGNKKPTRRRRAENAIGWGFQGMKSSNEHSKVKLQHKHHHLEVHDAASWVANYQADDLLLEWQTNGQSRFKSHSTTFHSVHMYASTIRIVELLLTIEKSLWSESPKSTWCGTSRSELNNLILSGALCWLVCMISGSRESSGLGRHAWLMPTVMIVELIAKPLKRSFWKWSMKSHWLELIIRRLEQSRVKFSSLCCRWSLSRGLSRILPLAGGVIINLEDCWSWIYAPSFDVDCWVGKSKQIDQTWEIDRETLHLDHRSSRSSNFLSVSSASQ